MQTHEIVKKDGTTVHPSQGLYTFAHFKNELAALKACLTACVVDPVAIEKGVQQLLAEKKAFLDGKIVELKRQVAEATARVQELDATAPNYQFWMDKVAEIQHTAARLVSRVEDELQPGGPLFEKKKVELYAENERRAMNLKSAMIEAWDKYEADLDNTDSEIGRKLAAYSRAKEPSDKTKANQELMAALWAPVDAMSRMVLREMKLLGIETPWMRFEGGVEQQGKEAEQGLAEELVAMMAAKL